MYSKYTSYQELKELNERYAGIELPELSSTEYDINKVGTKPVSVFKKSVAEI